MQKNTKKILSTIALAAFLLVGAYLATPQNANAQLRTELQLWDTSKAHSLILFPPKNILRNFNLTFDSASVNARIPAYLGTPVDSNLLIWQASSNHWVLTPYSPGSGGGGITQLHKDVTAGPGSGNQAATVIAIQGQTVSASVPVANQLFEYIGGHWQATSVTQDDSLSGAVWWVTGLYGHPIGNTVPAANQVLRYNGTYWLPQTLNFVSQIFGTVPVTIGGTDTVHVNLFAGTNVTIHPGPTGDTISASSSGGTVTAVTASCPLTSSGGATPNISICLAPGTGIAIDAGACCDTIENTGVISNIGGPGIVVSGATGNVTISNTGVLSVTGTAPIASSGGQNPSLSICLVGAGGISIVSGLTCDTIKNTVFPPCLVAGNNVTISAGPTCDTISSQQCLFSHPSTDPAAKGSITLVTGPNGCDTLIPHVVVQAGTNVTVTLSPDTYTINAHQCNVGKGPISVINGIAVGGIACDTIVYTSCLVGGGTIHVTHLANGCDSLFDTCCAPVIFPAGAPVQILGGDTVKVNLVAKAPIVITQSAIADTIKDTLRVPILVADSGVRIVPGVYPIDTIQGNNVAGRRIFIGSNGTIDTIINIDTIVAGLGGVRIRYGVNVDTIDNLDSGLVRTVTATAPMTSTGGINPNIALPILKYNGANQDLGLGGSANGSLTSATQVTSLGTNAGKAITSGNRNTALGPNALGAETIGGENVAIGSNGVLASQVGAFNNTAVGDNAGNAVTSGSQNTFVGESSGDRVTSGHDNTAVGNNSLVTDTLGLQNTALGSGADVLKDGLSNATAIGFNAKVDSSNSIQLGNSGVTVVSTSGTYTTSLGMNLVGATAPVTANGSTGTSGQVLTSAGAGATPTWQTATGTDSAVVVDSTLKKTVAGTQITLGTNPQAIVLDFKGVWTVKDTATGIVPITVTSDPGTPQFSYKIKAADIPTGGNANYVKRWNIAITMTGQDTNTILGSTLNWIIKYNGVAIGTSASSSVAVTAAKFWTFLGSMDSTLVVAGDSISIDLWGSILNALNFQNATIFIYPQTLYANNIYGTAAIASGAGSFNGDTIQSATITSFSSLNNTIVKELTWDSLIRGNANLYEQVTYMNNTWSSNSIIPLGASPFLDDQTNTNSSGASGANNTLSSVRIRFNRYFKKIIY